MDADETAKSPMMPNKRIRDRTDHTHASFTEFGAERVFDESDIGLSVGVGLVGHTMVGCESDRGAKSDHPCYLVIDTTMKVIGRRGARCIFMLHIVRR